MIFHWRLQYIVKMVIVLIASIDHFNIRSDDTKHTFGNNNYLTPDLGGQNDPTKDGQGHWVSQSLKSTIMFPSVPGFPEPIKKETHLDNCTNFW